MTINELRIGNYVEGIGMEEPIRKILDAIGYNYETEKYELDALDIQNFKPIPLTEEWLVKFGFEKNKDGLFNLFNQSEVPILLNPDLNGWTCDGINFSINNTQYVHQLQNLYFALTGEELKII
jgi:hypothetical protein